MFDKSLRKVKFLYQVNWDSLSGFTPDNKRGSFAVDNLQLVLNGSERIAKVSFDSAFYLNGDRLRGLTDSVSNPVGNIFSLGFEDMCFQNNYLMIVRTNNIPDLRETINLINNPTSLFNPSDNVIDKFPLDSALQSVNHFSTKPGSGFSEDMNIYNKTNGNLKINFRIGSRLYPNGTGTDLTTYLNATSTYSPVYCSINTLTFYIITEQNLQDSKEFYTDFYK